MQTERGDRPSYMRSVEFVLHVFQFYSRGRRRESELASVMIAVRLPANPRPARPLLLFPILVERHFRKTATLPRSNYIRYAVCFQHSSLLCPSLSVRVSPSWLVSRNKNLTVSSLPLSAPPARVAKTHGALPPPPPPPRRSFCNGVEASLPSSSSSSLRGRTDADGRLTP